MNAAIEKESIQRILVIKLRAIGDVILSTIVLQNMHEAFPQASIDFLTEPGGAGVLLENPLVTRIVVYNRKAMSGAGLIAAIRKNRYDMVVDLFGNPRTALVTRLSGARYRVGYRFRGRAYAYNILVEPRGNQVHNTQFNLDALERIGVPVVDRTLHIMPRSADIARASELWRKLIPPGHRVVAINPSGGWAIKRWPLERFAELADRLVEQFGCAILLPWGPGEEADVRKISAMMRHASVIPPRTSLLEMAALLQRCWFMVTNDSGPMHLASAMGVPIVGIFGPTNPLLQGPFGNGHVTVRNEELTCLACNLTECPIQNQCMKELTVERVFGAVSELVAKGAGRNTA